MDAVGCSGEVVVLADHVSRSAERYRMGFQKWPLWDGERWVEADGGSVGDIRDDRWLEDGKVGEGWELDDRTASLLLDWARRRSMRPSYAFGAPRGSITTHNSRLRLNLLKRQVAERQPLPGGGPGVPQI